MGMRAWEAGTERPPFLIAAAPGAGKTRPALEFARELLHRGRVRRVVVVTPTGPLTRQWASAAGRLGVHLQPGAATPRPPGDFHGIAVTYARVAQAGLKWARHVGPDTLVIADEAHHLGDELAWGEGFEAAFGPARDRWLLLSGTPFRSDQAAIPGVRYDAGGVAEADISFTYADAVRDGICRPVTFIPYDGKLQWRSGDDVVEASFADVLSGREAGRRYRTAISVELPDGLPRILEQANTRLEGLRAGGHRDAGGLVVAADGEHAKAIAKVLREVTGAAPVVVLHTDARSAERLTRFTDCARPLDRRGEHGQRGRRHPAAARRGVRHRRQDPADLPADRRALRADDPQAPRRAELGLPARRRCAAHPRGGGRDGAAPRAAPAVRGRSRGARRAARAPRDRARRAARVRARRRGREPPVADGPVRAARPGGRPRADPRARGPAPPDAGRMPAFERRKLLRDKRRRLVGELSRRDRRTHAEINGWLNRETGVQRVEDATLDQLDRSCELLLRALTRRG